MKGIKLWIALLIGMAVMVSQVSAAIVTRDVEYKDGDVTLQGYVAYDDAITGKRPGVLIVHQWMGLTDNETMRAEMLAGMGYVAFAVDMYGKGVRPQNRQEASEQAGKFYGDVAMLRQRVTAGLKQLRSFDNVDPAKVAAIGYCFGGKCVLELARSGADLSGVVSFHGGLATPNPADARNIKCPLLVCHGAEDPYVDGKEVLAFYEEMKAADVDYTFVGYANAVHAFTQKGAGDDPSQGAAYNAKADQRSWEHMKDFFAEIFPQK